MTPETHISQHLKWKEVRCKCRLCDGGAITPDTLELFERVRAASGGKPLTITSGFRCEKYNRIILLEHRTNAWYKRYDHVIQTIITVGITVFMTVWLPKILGAK